MNTFESPENNTSNLGEFEIIEIDRTNADNLLELIKRSINPKDIGLIKDPVEAEMLKFSVPELSDGGRLRPKVEDVFATKRALGQHYPVGYSQRSYELAIDNQLKSLFPNMYPLEFTDSEIWAVLDVMNKIDGDKLYEDMLRNVAANIPQGYAIFDILCHRFKQRWGRNPVVVDTGSSLGIPLKQWMLKEQYPFDPIEMFHYPLAGEPVTFSRADKETQGVINEIHNRESSLGQAIGYDAFPPLNSAEEIDWVYSNTFPMTEELRRPDLVSNFMSLANENPDNVEVLRHNIDARVPGSLEHLKDFLPNGKADFFIFSGVLFEMTPQEIAQVFENLVPYCNEGALFAVNEWAHVDRSQPSGLRVIREKWWNRPGQFSNFLLDPFKLHEPPVAIGHFLNRRCEAMMLTKAGRRMLLNPN